MSKRMKIAAGVFSLLLLTFCLWLFVAEGRYKYRVAAYHWYSRSPTLYYTNNYHRTPNGGIVFMGPYSPDSVRLTSSYNVTLLK